MERTRTERCVLCLDDDYEFLKSLEFFLPEQINRHCEQAHIIMGAAIDESLTDRLTVMVVASRRSGRASVRDAHRPE